MSRREDIMSCIDVTIVDRFAHSALPSPYSKIFPALRAGAAVTHAAGPGGKRFIDFVKPHACVSSVSMAGALRAGQGGFQVAVKAIRLDRRNRFISQSSKGPQPQIDAQTRDRTIENRADGRFISPIPRLLHAGHTDIEIPASAAVFTELTCTQFKVTETITVPQRQPTSREVDLSPSIANRSDLEGNPAERPPSTAALAPGQSDFLMLSPPSRVFFRDLLHRLDGKMQGAVTARDPFEEGPEIKSRQKPPLALEHFDRQFVAIIENRVDLARQATKPLRMLVLHPQAQDPSRGKSRAGHPYSISKTHLITPWQTSRNASRGRHAKLRVSLSLAGLKASVSRGETG